MQIKTMRYERPAITSIAEVIEQLGLSYYVMDMKSSTTPLENPLAVSNKAKHPLNQEYNS